MPAGDRITPGAPPPRRRWRRILAAVLTLVAGVLVYLALSIPNNISRLPEGSNTALALIRIPIEALLGVAVLLALPARWRTVSAAVGGTVLGLLTLVKIIDMGFFAALSRPFNPVLDFALLDDGFHFLTDSVGRTGARLVLVGAVLLALLLPVIMAWAVIRLSRFAARHRSAAAQTAAYAGIAFLVCALFSTHYVATVFVSSDSAVTLAKETVLTVPEGIRDKREFAAEAAVDRFRDTPPDRLLTGLRGKDVMFTVVESYGRSAVEDPAYAPQIDALLRAGGDRLRAAGYGARSAWLTAPTVGGGSWLSHATLQSGLWINNEQRYRTLMAGERLTLMKAFGRIDWDTVGIEPGLTYAWPEGRFYGFDRIYGSQALNYRGPRFSWATMPDQFTLRQFQTLERAKPGRAPLAAELTFVSSHSPWAPVPDLLPWDRVGDGSVYGPMIAGDPTATEVWRDDDQVRDNYRRCIEYSLNSILSYIETYGDENLVMIFLGDHQPSPIITGTNASRDVPVTVVAKDPTVLDRMGGLGWQDGLKPGPTAPVSRMDAFRDQFLTAFSDL